MWKHGVSVFGQARVSARGGGGDLMIIVHSTAACLRPTQYPAPLKNAFRRGAH